MAPRLSTRRNVRPPTPSTTLESARRATIPQCGKSDKSVGASYPTDIARQSSWRVQRGKSAQNVRHPNRNRVIVCFHDFIKEEPATDQWERCFAQSVSPRTASSNGFAAGVMQGAL
jgi:hypothetical protein